MSDAEKRYYEFAGDQVVEVDGYAYRWDGATPLEVGDRVVVPFGWRGPQEGVVTALGTTYDDELSSVIRRVGPAAPELTAERDATIVIDNEAGERVGKLRFDNRTVEWQADVHHKISLQALIEFIKTGGTN